MNRREGLKYLSAGWMMAVLSPSVVCKGVYSEREQKVDYASLVVDYSPPAKVPEDRRIPFDWKFFAVGKNEQSAYLKLNESIPKKYEGIKIRLTTAVKIKDKQRLEISIPKAGILLGIIDLKHSPEYQISELDIDEKALPEIRKYGIRLRQISEGEPLFFVAGNDHASESSTLLPHLYFIDKKKHQLVEQFINRLYSLNSLQEFGWMEGCVLDGLWQIYDQRNSKKALETINAHLELFFGEDIDSLAITFKLKNYKISSIESTLPFAIIARLYPKHPVLKEVEDFWNSRIKAHGGITDYSITAEGCYTVAYPMAVFSRMLNRPDLAKMALQQLRIRKKLVDKGNNYLRYYPDNDTRTYKNWARGIAWYMLGLIRTISVLKDTEELGDLKEEFTRVSNFVLDFQKSDGLFNCYIDDESTTTDTSGSAGIAAAIATGIHEGLLNENLRNNILLTWKGLIPFLTPDGLLSGVAQSNSGGEELQRSEYRVISQMGMGLMGQLYAYQ